MVNKEKTSFFVCRYLFCSIRSLTILCPRFSATIMLMLTLMLLGYRISSPNMYSGRKRLLHLPFFMKHYVLFLFIKLYYLFQSIDYYTSEPLRVLHINTFINMHIGVCVCVKCKSNYKQCEWGPIYINMYINICVWIKIL